jgi:hypothetical protein
MPEETRAAGSEREDYISRRLDRLEQKLAWEDRWWRGGLLAALVFIAIAILIAGHHHRRRPPFPPWMAYGPAGQFPPPPAWGWGPPSGYGWGPGQWGGSRAPMPPPSSESK